MTFTDLQTRMKKVILQALAVDTASRTEALWREFHQVLEDARPHFDDSKEP